MKRVSKRLYLRQKVSGVLSAFVFHTIKRGAVCGAASTHGPMTHTAGSTERASDYTKDARRGSWFRSWPPLPAACWLCLCELTCSSHSISTGQRAQAELREGLREGPVCLWLMCRDESLPQGHSALSPLRLERKINTARCAGIWLDTALRCSELIFFHVQIPDVHKRKQLRSMMLMIRY